MPVAPVQRRSKATYRNILVAAGKLLEREGVSQITVQRVAELAGVDARLVRYYFDDLEGLMMVIAEYVTGQWSSAYRQLLAGYDDPRDAIQHAFDVGWRRISRGDSPDRRTSLVVQEIRLGAARNAALRPLPRRGRAEIVAAWVEVFEHAADRFDYLVDPAVVAGMIHDAWEGAVAQYLAVGDAADAERTLRGFIRAICLTITPRSHGLAG